MHPLIVGCIPGGLLVKTQHFHCRGCGFCFLFFLVSVFNITIREMQIKTIIKYHLTLVRMAIVLSLQIVNARECWRKKKRNLLLHCWWECKLVLPLQKTVELPYDEQSQAKKNMVRKDTGTCVHYSTVPRYGTNINVH